MQLCLEEMEPVRQEVVGQAAAGVWAEEAGALAGWEAIGREPDLVGSVSAPTVVPARLIR